MAGTGTPRNITRNQIYTDYNFEKAFIFDNEFIRGQYTNSTGSEVTLSIGRVMGRISASGLFLPLVSTASDGSQFPVGILAENVTVANNATVNINICVKGDVNQNVLSFASSETLDTVISGRRLRDRIAADTQGIRIVPTVENTRFDN